jgi:SAM-dependent methyltransferase
MWNVLAFGLKRALRWSPRFGVLGTTQPISTSFGFDRGTPIDRYYIERFLAGNAALIRGRTLEIGDDSYTARFGGARTSRRDVLHVTPGHPGASFTGDLATTGTLPADAFDCAVITQTLHLVYDMAAAVRELHRALRPGGSLLVTVPGISQIDKGEWGKTWFWALTPVSARRLFEPLFGEQSVTVQAFGNVFAATVFLQGLAVEDVPQHKLEVIDEAYPVTVAVRAIKGELQNG